MAWLRSGEIVREVQDTELLSSTSGPQAVLPDPGLKPWPAANLARTEQQPLQSCTALRGGQFWTGCRSVHTKIYGQNRPRTKAPLSNLNWLKLSLAY